VLHENPVENVKLFHDESSSKWGQYIYENLSERPEEEQVFYDLLTENDETISDLIHFWRQLCLNWPILTANLQKLSQAIPDSNGGNQGAPLLHFKTKYEILFDCLEAVFGCMMSNSRLCEQTHGMMRHGLRTSVCLKTKKI
jgi:hypothetical protein